MQANQTAGLEGVFSRRVLSNVNKAEELYGGRGHGTFLVLTL